MELTFNKDGNLYVTEFEVTADFNLHLERDKGGKVSFYQRSTNGQYDTIEELEKNIDLVFDYDFQSLVWPKYIKITSESLPTVATLTTNGEVTEIKSQSKEVEIVSNGTTEVTPDAGYSYLSGVSVKVNVPQEGGGGGSNIEYLDISGANENVRNTLVVLAENIKSANDEGVCCGLPLAGTQFVFGITTNNASTTIAVGVDFSRKIKGDIQGQLMELSIIDLITMTGISKESIDALPRITEEEFYNTNTTA